MERCKHIKRICGNVSEKNFKYQGKALDIRNNLLEIRFSKQERKEFYSGNLPLLFIIVPINLIF